MIEVYRMQSWYPPMVPTRGRLVSPYEHCGCFSSGDLEGFPPPLPQEAKSELEADYVRIDSARVDSMSAVSSPFIEDDFLGLLAS